MYDNNEFCIWTVNSTGDIWNDLQVTLIEQAFERGRDAIETYSIYYSTSSTTGLSLCSLYVLTINVSRFSLQWLRSFSQIHTIILLNL